MTVIDVDRDTGTGNLEPSHNRIEVTAEPSDKLLVLRKRFVERMGWLDYSQGETDRDRYDDEPGTHHVTSIDSAGNIVASLRLTETPTVEDSLSWSMLSEAAKQQASQSGLMPVPGREIMDMTRLVVDVRASEEDRIREIARILGEAVKLSDDNTTWVFTLERHFAAFLGSMNVPFKVIASGLSSTEKGDDVLFCRIDPVAKIEEVDSEFGMTASRVANNE
jgi:hypothetical protein